MLFRSTVNLSTNYITDIGLLANLVNLTGLRLSNNRIVDASPLNNLVNLEYVNIQYNPDLDKSTLKKLPEEPLELGDVNVDGRVNSKEGKINGAIIENMNRWQRSGFNV